jgi:hypothetical protein
MLRLSGAGGRTVLDIGFLYCGGSRPPAFPEAAACPLRPEAASCPLRLEGAACPLRPEAAAACTWVPETAVFP